MKLLLIAGHGASDPGATATIRGVTYREATETRVVAAGLAKSLAGFAEVTVYPTDRNAFEDYKSGALATLAKFSQYDYVLEIHFNALKADAGDGKTKGTEIYVTTTANSTAVEAGIVARLAKLGLANRGVKRYNWSVIQRAKQAGVSAALLEVCFIDDADDMAVYLRDKLAVVRSIADGIIAGFGLRKEEKTVTTQEAKKVIQDKAGLSAATIAFLECYKFADDLLVKLAGAMK